MGGLLVAGFASFNSGSFLVSRLFTQSTKSYQKSRSIMKRKITQITKPPESDGEGLSEKDDNIFKAMRIKAAKSSVVSDF
jgi:hypothetical protein